MGRLRGPVGPLDGNGRPLDESLGELLGVNREMIRFYALRMMSELYVGEALPPEVQSKLGSKASIKSLQVLREMVGEELGGALSDVSIRGSCLR